MNKSTKQILIGAALIIIPFSSLFVGGYYLYQGYKRRQQQKENK